MFCWNLFSKKDSRWSTCGGPPLVLQCYVTIPAWVLFASGNEKWNTRWQQLSENGLVEHSYSGWRYVTPSPLPRTTQLSPRHYVRLCNSRKNKSSFQPWGFLPTWPCGLGNSWQKRGGKPQEDSSVTLIMINANVYMAYVLVRTHFCVKVRV